MSGFPELRGLNSTIGDFAIRDTPFGILMKESEERA
jgi:hypothetical protein